MLSSCQHPKPAWPRVSTPAFDLARRRNSILIPLLLARCARHCSHHPAQRYRFSVLSSIRVRAVRERTGQNSQWGQARRDFRLPAWPVTLHAAYIRHPSSRSIAKGQPQSPLQEPPSARVSFSSRENVRPLSPVLSARQSAYQCEPYLLRPCAACLPVVRGLPGNLRKTPGGFSWRPSPPGPTSVRGKPPASPRPGTRCRSRHQRRPAAEPVLFRTDDRDLHQACATLTLERFEADFLRKTVTAIMAPKSDPDRKAFSPCAIRRASPDRCSHLLRHIECTVQFAHRRIRRQPFRHSRQLSLRAKALRPCLAALCEFVPDCAIRWIRVRPVRVQSPREYGLPHNRAASACSRGNRLKPTRATDIRENAANIARGEDRQEARSCRAPVSGAFRRFRPYHRVNQTSFPRE